MGSYRVEKRKRLEIQAETQIDRKGELMRKKGETKIFECDLNISTVCVYILLMIESKRI